MNHIGPIANQGVVSQPKHLSPSREPRPESLSDEAESGDRVELSAAASRSAPPVDTPEVSEQRSAEIRAQIADGTYLTPDKLDAAIEALLRDVLGGA
jgi:negative regulator of flagellin synthesis FlgM